MNYKLDVKYQHAKRLGNGKRRSILLYFINDVLVYKQKVPFDEKSEPGVAKWNIDNKYILDGYLYQRRHDKDWDFINGRFSVKSRDVKYPLSKSLLKDIGVPNGVKLLFNV